MKFSVQRTALLALACMAVSTTLFAAAPVLNNATTPQLPTLVGVPTANYGTSVGRLVGDLITDPDNFYYGNYYEDFDDNNYKSTFGGGADEFNDRDNGGSSSAAIDIGNYGPSGSRALKLSGSFNNPGSCDYCPFLGISWPFLADSARINLSRADTIRYRYRGMSHAIRLSTSNITDWGYYSIELPEAKTWTQAAIPLIGGSTTTYPDLLVNGGFDAAGGTLAPWAVTSGSGTSGISWSVKMDDQASATISSGSVTIAQTVKNLQPNTTYTVRGRAKAGSATYPVALGVRNYGGNDTTVTTGALYFELLAITFRTGATTDSAVIYFSQPNSANATPCFFDSFTMLPGFGVFRQPLWGPDWGPEEKNMAKDSSTHISWLIRRLNGSYPVVDSLFIDDIEFRGLDGKGIAITGTDVANGVWEYSVNHGTTWQTVGTVSNSAALLLNDSALVRFVPNAGFHGTASFYYRAWDQSVGYAGQSGVNASSGGTTTPFSALFDTAVVQVEQINTAPRMNTVTSPVLVAEDSGPQTFVLRGIGDGDDWAVQTLSFTVVSATPAVIPAPTVIYTQGADTALLSFTTVQDVSGSSVITVRIKDNGGIANNGVDSLTISFTITVTPVNDAPTAVMLSRTSIEEKAPIGTLVGILGAADPDISDTHTFSITGGDSGFFTISGDSLKTAAVLDYAARPALSVQIRAADAGTPALSKDSTFTIQVTEYIDTVPPVNGSVLTLNALGPTTLDVRWKTPESPSPDARTVFVYRSTTAKPTPAAPGTLVSSLPVSDSIGERQVLLIGLTAETRYYVALWISDGTGLVSASIIDSVVMPAQDALLNPVVVRGQRVSDTRIALTLSNYGSLPTTGPFTSYVDSIGVWYKTAGFPSTPAQGTSVWYKMAELNAAGTTFRDTLDVPSLTSSGDSSYYLVTAPHWKLVGGDSISPFNTTNGAVVFMLDTARVAMNLDDTASYLASARMLTVTITNAAQIDPAARTLALWYGLDNNVNFADSTVTRMVLLDTVTVTGGRFSIGLSDPVFSGDTHTVYYAMALVGANGLWSATKVSSALVGSLRPVNDITLQAQTLSAYEVKLDWSRADSVRIWYGTTRVPLSHEVGTGFTLVQPGSAVTTLRISTLEASTTYHFGLQLYKDLMWSDITLTSSDSATTDSLSGHLTIPNTLNVSSASFDLNTNKFQIAYEIDTTGFGVEGTLQIGVRQSLQGYVTTDTGTIDVFTVAQLRDTLRFSLPEAVLSDTTYYLSCWLRMAGGRWAEPTVNSSVAVKINKITWQAVRYFTPADTTIQAFNSRILLQQNAKFSGPIEDTLDLIEPTMTLPAGLHICGSMFSFRRHLASQQFYVAIRVDSVPAGFDTTGLRLYRQQENGTISVEHASYFHDGYVWLLTNSVKEPFMLLADRQPVILNFDLTATDTAAIVGIGDSVFNKFILTDNIVNSRWSVFWGSGNNTYTDSLSGTTKAGLDTIRTRIAASQVNHVFGLRAMIVVTDGVHVDTIDVSRNVAVTEANQISTSGMVWTPVIATATLSEPACAVQFDELALAGVNWEYDVKRFRMFRWDPSGAGSSATDKWTEFNKNAPSSFDLHPGALFWIKTAEDRLLRLGSGVSLTLKEPHAINLPAGQYTDFCNPFKWEVHFSDILAASGPAAHDLRVYQWTLDSGVYKPLLRYAPEMAGIDTLVKTLQLQFEQGKYAYTVYNPGSAPVALKIPPIPPALHKTRNQGLTKTARNAVWSVAIQWKTSESQRHPSECLVSHQESGSQDRYFPPPPSFSRCGLVLERQGGISGSAILGGSAMQTGGIAQQVRLYNDEAQARTLFYRVDKEELSARNLCAAIYDPKTGAFEEVGTWNRVELAPGTATSRYLVIGSTGYLDDFRSGFNVSALALTRIFPNPAHTRLHIQYTLPYDNVKAVRFAIFALNGRTVWQTTLSGKLQHGPGVVVWNGRDSRHNAVASGTYLLRMTVEHADGMESRPSDRRITLLP